jgi:p-cumate 2,3-dioxygenase subunit beta
MSDGSREAKASGPRRGQDIAVSEVERLFYDEAALLDAWKLEEWLKMLTEDVEYIVPTLDHPEGSPRTAVHMVADNAMRVRSRVQQLLGGYVLPEDPPSRTRRFVANVRILSAGERDLKVAANFMIYRFRSGITTTFVGTYEHDLVLVEDTLRIRKRLCTLDMESLRPHGSMTFIV